MMYEVFHTPKGVMLQLSRDDGTVIKELYGYESEADAKGEGEAMCQQDIERQVRTSGADLWDAAEDMPIAPQ